MAVNNDPPVQLQPNTSESDKVAFINQNFRKLSNSLSPFQISDGNNNILNIGKDSTGGYSMKVAKTGYDAFDAADENLIFNSNHNVFKIVASGTVKMPTYSVSSGAGWVVSSVPIPPSVTIAHGLSRVPLVVAYLQATGPGGKTSLALPYTDFGVIGAASYFHSISISVDSTYISFNEATLTNGSVGTLTHGGTTIEYYILQESAK